MIVPLPGLRPERRRFLAGRLCLTFAVLGCSGCGEKQPYEIVPVSGRVTYEDGTPLPAEGGLRLAFYADAPPVDGKFHPRPGSAFPDAEGNFSEAMTRRPGDGLIAGTHHVTIWYMGRDTRGIVPDQFTLKGKTPIVVDTAEQPFEIKVPRP